MLKIIQPVETAKAMEVEIPKVGVGDLYVVN